MPKHTLWLALAAGAACLAPRAALAQHEHEHAEQGEVHSHRGPGPHYIDGFYTENAYLERKIRPDLVATTGDWGDRWTAHVEVEWALTHDLALIAHAPFLRQSLTGAGTETGLGDVSVGGKYAIVNGREFILATGADLELATGSESRGLGEGHTTAEPFLLAWIPFGGARRWLLQLAGHAELPLVAAPERRAALRAALSWTSPLGVTPLLEAMTDAPLGSGGPTTWAVAPGFRWEFREAWEVGASLRLPLGSVREDDAQVTVGFIHHFPKP